jgi:hypothetical protein
MLCYAVLLEAFERMPSMLLHIRHEVQIKKRRSSDAGETQVEERRPTRMICWARLG